jgi:hypothetical protein
MGIWDAFAELVEAAKPWGVVEAEAPADDSKVRSRAKQLHPQHVDNVFVTTSAWTLDLLPQLQE